MYRVGFKPTDSHAILCKSSFHPRSVFKSIVFGHVYRWATRSSCYRDFCDTKSVVQPRWLEQGYTRSAIRTAVRRVFSLTGQTPQDWATGFFPCTVSCKICIYSTFTSSVFNFVNNNQYRILHRLTCQSRNVIYFIVCKKCFIGYVGQTSRALSQRISQHVYDIRSKQETPVARHFNGTCDIRSFSFTGLEHCPQEKKRLIKENKWIQRLHTLQPQGLNAELNQRDVLHLVLPFSQCSERVVQLCRSQLPNTDLCPSFRMHRSIGKILSKNR